MATQRSTDRLTAAVGGAALLAMLSLTAACETSEAASETETTTMTTTTETTTTAPPVNPTEQAPRIDPREPNAFTPEHTAPPPATGIPGRHR